RGRSLHRAGLRARWGWPLSPPRRRRLPAACGTGFSCICKPRFQRPLPAVHSQGKPSAMARIVMQFGGTSVAGLNRIRNVARHVKREVDAGDEVALVVAAMAGKTHELVGWTRELSPLHDAREYDTVVAAGEQVASRLLAVALQTIWVNARS